MLPVPGFEFGVEAEVDEGVLGGGRDDVHGAAVAAVAAVGATAGDELLAAEAEAAVAAVARRDLDVDVVDEHAISARATQCKRRARGAGALTRRE